MILNSLFHPLLSAACSLLHVSIDASALQGLEPPYFVLCNHPSYYDWVYALKALWPVQPVILINRNYFTGLQGVLLRKMGHIPRSLFVVDPVSVRQVLTAVRHKKVVVIYPNPSLSLCGAETGEPMPGTYTLLQRLHLPVVLLKTEGSYFTKPKWASQLRPGAIHVTASRLFTPEQLRTLPPEEGEARVLAALRYDDNKAPFAEYPSKKIAEGLENILLYCPRCQCAAEIRAEGARLQCARCGAAATLSPAHRLQWDAPYHGPETIRDWYRSQCACFAEKARPLSDQAEVVRYYDGKKCHKNAGEGRLTLSEEALLFEGQVLGAPLTVRLPLEQLHQLCWTRPDSLLFFSGETSLTVRPKTPKAILWTETFDVLRAARCRETMKERPREKTAGD